MHTSMCREICRQWECRKRGDRSPAAEQECVALIANSDILSKPAGDTQSRAAHRLLRHAWQPNNAASKRRSTGKTNQPKSANIVDAGQGKTSSPKLLRNTARNSPRPTDA